MTEARTRHPIAFWLLCGVCSAAALWPPPQSLHLVDGFAQAVESIDDADFVVLWPPHQDQALEHLPKHLRAAAAVPLERNKQRRYRRLDVLGVAGSALPPELSAFEPTGKRSFGDVVLTSYTLGNGVVRWDLRDHLAGAGIRFAGKLSLDCDQWTGDRWLCPGRPAWNYVGHTSATVDGGNWSGIWAHPVAGSPLTLTLAGVPEGSLRLEAALSDQAATTTGGAPVRITLTSAGRDHRLIRTNRSGIVSQVVPHRSGDVQIKVETDSDARRHLLLNLRVMAP